MVVCCFVLLFCFVVLLFCCFVVLFCLLQLCPILAYFFLIEALIELRKMLLRKKLFDVRLSVWELLNPALRYPDSADLQRCN